MLSVLQILLVVAFAAAFFVTLKRGRQGQISRFETFAWCALWFVAAIVAVLPDVTSLIANAVGVGRGADFVLYVSVAALFYLTFRIFLRLDKIDRDITSLVRTVSLRDSERK